MWVLSEYFSNKTTILPISSLIKIFLSRHPFRDCDAFVNMSLTKTFEYYKMSIQNDPQIPFDKKLNIIKSYQEAFKRE
jgi:hypothetical protein